MSVRFSDSPQYLENNSSHSQIKLFFETSAKFYFRKGLFDYGVWSGYGVVVANVECKIQLPRKKDLKRKSWQQLQFLPLITILLYIYFTLFALLFCLSHVFKRNIFITIKQYNNKFDIE